MADMSQLSSRDVIGRFFLALEAANTQTWANRVGMLFKSDQATENYKWLGMSPMLREWIGGRNAKGLRQTGVSITNKKFEATLAIDKDDLRRDKTGQVQVRIDDLARRANQHWNSLLSTLIINGESVACYDGQFFFDTDHSEGDSGTQTNDLAVGDYSELNVATATNPTANELADVIVKMVQHLFGFKDDQGEPLNEDANEFIVMVPVPFYGAALQAVTSKNLNTGSGVRDNPVASGAFKVNVVANARLTWTTKLALFRTDASAKPFILQEETGPTMQAVAEGSEHEFKHREHLYGVEADRNVGYGFWQHAVLATLS